jgi:hypothetical protein
MRRAGCRAVVAAVAVLVASGCGGAAGSAAPAGGVASRPAASSSGAAATGVASAAGSAPAGATGTGVSALAALQPYLQQVAARAAQLQQVAALINVDVTPTDIRLRPGTARAIQDAQDSTALRRAVPAGMSVALTKAALRVFSNLASRAAAFRGVLEAPTPVSAASYRSAMACLANGGAAAAGFAADVAALRSLSARSPAFTPAPESSRAAAEIALQADFVGAREAGGDSCGGYVGDDLQTIVWGHPTGISGPADGTINGVDFSATYHAGTGWAVQIHAG